MSTHVDLPLPGDDDSRKPTLAETGSIVRSMTEKGLFNSAKQDKRDASTTQEAEQQAPVQQTTSILDGVRKGRLWLYSLAILSILSGFGTFFLTRMYYEATVIPRAVELYKQELEGLKDPKLKKASIPTGSASSVRVAVSASSPASTPSPQIICVLTGDGVHKTKEGVQAFRDAENKLTSGNMKLAEFRRIKQEQTPAKDTVLAETKTKDEVTCASWKETKMQELFE